MNVLRAQRAAAVCVVASLTACALNTLWDADASWSAYRQPSLLGVLLVLLATVPLLAIKKRPLLAWPVMCLALLALGGGDYSRWAAAFPVAIGMGVVAYFRPVRFWVPASAVTFLAIFFAVKGDPYVEDETGLLIPAFYLGFAVAGGLLIRGIQRLIVATRIRLTKAPRSA